MEFVRGRRGKTEGECIRWAEGELYTPVRNQWALGNASELKKCPELGKNFTDSE